MKKLTEFTQNVLEVIRKIPRGRVTTYGQVALLAGNSQGVRGVVWILHSCSRTQDLPWHRVINSKGRISFQMMSDQYLRQKALLNKEGVVFLEGERVDLKVYQWKP